MIGDLYDSYNIWGELNSLWNSPIKNPYSDFTTEERNLKDSKKEDNDSFKSFKLAIPKNSIKLKF